jgi:pyruvate carboxylase
VLGYLRGDLGEPAGGLPRPFASRALRAAGRAGASDPRTAPELADDLETPGQPRRTALGKLMFPGPFADFEESRVRYGDISVLPTRTFFYGLQPGVEEAIDLDPGVRLVIELDAVGDADERGMRTVLSRLNGQLRTLDVRDESIEAGTPAVERADPDNAEHVAAPLAGVVTLQVDEGDEVTDGEPIAVLEAMKMESTITAPRAGTVKRIAVKSGRRLEPGDLILTLTRPVGPDLG